MKAKQSILLIITLILTLLSISNVSAADYNVNSSTDVSGINSWLSFGASSGDTLFFNLNPADIITSLSNLVISVSINIVSNTGTVIQGNSGDNLFDIRANNVNVSGLTINDFNQAVTVNGGNNTTIKNNTFNNNQGSIAIYNSNNSTVTNNTIKNNGGNNAIGLGNSNYTDVNNNTIENTGATAIATWDSENNKISNNKINTVSNGEGIYASGNNHQITKNEIENANNGIYLQNANNTTITNNKVSKNKYQGIFVQMTSKTIIANNQANYNNNSGIIMLDSANVQIINNTCNFNGDNTVYTNIGDNNGIYLSGTMDNISVSGNVAEGNLRNGIAIASNYRDALLVNIFNNTCNNNSENGIYLGRYSGLYLYNQTVFVYNNIVYSNNQSGIVNSLNSTIYNNIIYGNKLSGVYTIGTSNIANNTISNNYEGVTVVGSNNTISRNTLINNTIGFKLNNYNQPYLDSPFINGFNTTNNIFEYNRIVNSTSNLVIESILPTYGDPGVVENNSGNFNWWGQNDPEESLFQNSSAFNASYWFVTNLTSLQDSVDEGVPALFNYTIGLNDPSVAANSMNLPYFTFAVDGNSYDARVNQSLQKLFNVTADTEETFGFFVDNQWLEAKVNVMDVPTPIPPTPNPTPTPTPDPIDPADPDDTNNTTDTTNNPTAKAAVMKESGIPIIAILIVLLSSLGLIYRRK